MKNGLQTCLFGSSADVNLLERGGRVVCASGSETSVLSSTPASAIIYDAYTSIINKKKTDRMSFLIYFPLT